MDATRDCHMKKSKSERDRQIPYDITYMLNLKYNTETGSRWRRSKIWSSPSPTNTSKIHLHVE